MVYNIYKRLQINKISTLMLRKIYLLHNYLCKLNVE
jgi:hypothetical protein